MPNISKTSTLALCLITALLSACSTQDRAALEDQKYTQNRPQSKCEELNSQSAREACIRAEVQAYKDKLEGRQNF